MEVETVWVVAWNGEHEDWPLAVFRDKEMAEAWKTVMNSSLALVQEKTWDEVDRLWRALYNE